MAMGATGIRNGQPTWNTGMSPLAVILASFQFMAAQPLSDSGLRRRSGALWPEHRTARRENGTLVGPSVSCCFKVIFAQREGLACHTMTIKKRNTVWPLISRIAWVLFVMMHLSECLSSKRSILGEQKALYIRALSHDARVNQSRYRGYNHVCLPANLFTRPVDGF